MLDCLVFCWGQTSESDNDKSRTVTQHLGSSKVALIAPVPLQCETAERVVGPVVHVIGRAAGSFGTRDRSGSWTPGVHVSKLQQDSLCLLASVRCHSTWKPR